MDVGSRKLCCIDGGDASFLNMAAQYDLRISALYYICEHLRKVLSFLHRLYLLPVDLCYLPAALGTNLVTNAHNASIFFKLYI